MAYLKNDFYFVKWNYTTINFENIFKLENMTHYAFMPDSCHLKPISEVTFGKWSHPNQPTMDVFSRKLLGANTRDATHDKAIREKTWPARRIRFSGVSKRTALEISPMTRSRGESLTGKADQVFRDFEKLPPALTFKMMSVFLMPASMDYFLISLTQAEGLPRSLPK